MATLGAGKGAHGVVASRDGRRVYVTNTFGDSVSVIDVESQSVLNNAPDRSAAKWHHLPGTVAWL